MINPESTEESEKRFWRLGDRIALGMIAAATLLAGYVYFSLR